MAGQKIARGLDIGRISGKMARKATREETSGKVWEEEFAKGTTNWAYWMRIVMPYIQTVGIDPDLTPEQKQVAVKETFKAIKQGLPLFLASCAQKGRRFAKAVIPVRASSPPVMIPPDLIV